ncbi:MAG: hypothetical protein ACOCVG_00510 [Verrucomicrobiota bacterium]
MRKLRNSVSFLGLAALFLAAGSALGQSVAPVLKFSAPAESPDEVSEGHVELRWTLVEEGALDAEEAEGVRFQLEQATVADFSDATERYVGRDLGSFISGLAEGNYYFRVRAVAPSGEPGAWSEPMQVTVDYPNVRLVQTLLIAGAIVLVLTVGAIIAGHLKTKKESARR